VAPYNVYNPNLNYYTRTLAIVFDQFIVPALHPKPPGLGSLIEEAGSLSIRDLWLAEGHVVVFGKDGRIKVMTLSPRLAQVCTHCGQCRVANAPRTSIMTLCVQNYRPAGHVPFAAVQSSSCVANDFPMKQGCGCLIRLIFAKRSQWKT
jgi:hypothetical protein